MVCRSLNDIAIITYKYIIFIKERYSFTQCGAAGDVKHKRLCLDFLCLFEVSHMIADNYSDGWLSSAKHLVFVSTFSFYQIEFCTIHNKVTHSSSSSISSTRIVTALSAISASNHVSARAQNYWLDL